MTISSLLKSKNRCLENFLEVSTKYLGDLPENESNFESMPDLDQFDLRRGSSLRAANLFDRKINETLALRGRPSQNSKELEEIRAALDAHDELIRRILKIDQQIIRRLDSIRNLMREEISTTQRQNQTISKFRSTWVSHAGEELDEKA